MEIHFCLTVHFFNRPVYPAVFMSVKKLLVSIKKNYKSRVDYVIVSKPLFSHASISKNHCQVIMQL